MTQKTVPEAPLVNGNPNDLLTEWDRKRIEKLPDEWTGKKDCIDMMVSTGIFLPKSKLGMGVAPTPNDLAPLHGVTVPKCMGSVCMYWDADYKSCVKFRYHKSMADMAERERIHKDD